MNSSTSAVPWGFLCANKIDSERGLVVRGEIGFSSGLIVSLTTPFVCTKPEMEAVEDLRGVVLVSVEMIVMVEGTVEDRYY